MYCICLFFITQLYAQNTFPPNGKVGIGTLVPAEELDVIGTVKAEELILSNINSNQGVLSLGNNQGGDNKLTLNVNPFSYSFEYNSDNNKQRISTIITNGSGSNSSGYFQNIYLDANGIPFFQLTHASFGSYLSLPKPETKLLIGGGNWASSSHNLVVNSGTSFFNGNVGIGTESFIDGNDNNIEYKLSVNGKVRANEVKVYTTWADFVFKEDYILPALVDVELFIKKNGHLKDIPNAEKVEAEGIKLGEMNKLLLQKIEELTLYTIQQQNLIEELQKEVKNIKIKQ